MPDQLTQTMPRRSINEPDPSTLTAIAVSSAKEDLRRESEAATKLTDSKLENLQEQVRNHGTAISVSPVEREELRTRLQSDISTAIDNLHSLVTEKFKGVENQFQERDTRGEQEKKASKEALDAALLAQKESVSQQNDANTTAAQKSETSFTKQIDQIGTLIATLEKSLTDRITELKERIDRGEGTDKGTIQSADQTRADASLSIIKAALTESVASGKQQQQRSVIAIGVSVLSALIAMVVAVVLILHGGELMTNRDPYDVPGG